MALINNMIQKEIMTANIGTYKRNWISSDQPNLLRRKKKRIRTKTQIMKI